VQAILTVVLATRACKYDSQLTLRFILISPNASTIQKSDQRICLIRINALSCGTTIAGSKRYHPLSIIFHKPTYHKTQVPGQSN